MNENNITLLVLGLSLAVVVMLAGAPVLNNEEMAYASNTQWRRRGIGGSGGSGSSSTSVACNPPITCSFSHITWRRSISCNDPSFFSGGAFAAGAAGGNGAAGNSGPNGAGGSGGSGGMCISYIYCRRSSNKLLLHQVVQVEAGGASGPGHKPLFFYYFIN